jgi:hypothetical protein
VERRECQICFNWEQSPGESGWRVTSSPGAAGWACPACSGKVQGIRTGPVGPSPDLRRGDGGQIQERQGFTTRPAGLPSRSTGPADVRSEGGVNPAVYHRLYAGATALGLAGFLWCAFEHVCMCGHMQHPPYPAHHYAIDASWVASFAAAVVCGLSRQPPYVIGPLLMAGLTASRFLTGSGPMGCFLLLEFPVVLCLAGLALYAAFRRVRDEAEVGSRD